MPQRPHLDIVGHQKWKIAELDPENLIPINNIVILAKTEDEKWLQESMELIGEWRAIFRSIYIKWALAINGLHVARDRYSQREWQASKQFFVTSFRVDSSGQAQTEQIAVWAGPETVKNHNEVMPYIAKWGIIDLGSALEECIFDLYRVFHWQHTEHLTGGPDFKELRKLRNASANSPEDLAKWQAAFATRLENWQRNAVYKPKRELFLNYCNFAGLKTPSTYKQTTLESWADSLDGVFILRNCLIHPNATVPKELGDFAASKFNTGYDFKTGAPLEATLKHLQCTECFLDQLLTGINLSLVERTGAKLPTEESGSKEKPAATK